MVKKVFTEIRLCNLMTYFKGHVAVVKIYMVKFKLAWNNGIFVNTK